MRYFGSAVTDIGIKKQTNQDSVCLKIANTVDRKSVVMAIVCDGMGGLEKGELASATVIRRLSEWFHNEFPIRMENFSWAQVSIEWSNLVKRMNYEILNYGKTIKMNLGTTLTAMLIVENEYMIVHVGDSRVYKIDDEIQQVTEDQTFIAREIKNGNMTPEEASKDKRRNMLLQCIGASKNVEPEIIFGKVTVGEVYMLCSDGFRHKISEEEIFNEFHSESVQTISELEMKEKHLIAIIKARQEKDNISVVVIKCAE